ncbi:histidine kinase N-terminal 7TM domain-containing protein, partial [Planomonospora corallina]
MREPMMALLFTLSAVVAFGMVAIGWRRRHVAPAVGALTVVAAAVGTWSLADAFLLLDSSLEGLQPGLLVKFLAIGVLPAGFHCLTLTVIDRAWRPSRRLLLWLAAEPALVTLALLTNPWHQGFIVALDPENQWGENGWLPGPLFWAHTVYSYGLIAMGIVRIVGAWLRGPRAQRGLYGSILLATLPPLALNAASLLGLASVDYLTPAGFCATTAIAYWSLVRRSLHELVPVERTRVFDMLSDMVMTVDASGRVLDLNPAAERLLRQVTPAAPARVAGLRVVEVLGGVRFADRAEGGAEPPGDDGAARAAAALPRGGDGPLMTLAERKRGTDGTPALPAVDPASGLPVNRAESDYTVTDPEGRRIDLNVRASALHDNRGHTVGWAFVGRD